MRYLTNKEQRKAAGLGGFANHKDRWRAGRKHLPAVCPKCRQAIQVGQWIKMVPGRGFVLAHGYNCPGGRP